LARSRWESASDDVAGGWFCRRLRAPATRGSGALLVCAIQLYADCTERIVQCQEKYAQAGHFGDNRLSVQCLLSRIAASGGDAPDRGHSSVVSAAVSTSYVEVGRRRHPAGGTCRTCGATRRMLLQVEPTVVGWEITIRGWILGSRRDILRPWVSRGRWLNDCRSSMPS
jgi:hypothetical protein